MIRWRNIVDGSPEHLFISTIDPNHASFEGRLVILILLILVSCSDLHLVDLGFLNLLFVGCCCWSPADLNMLFLLKLHLNLFLLFWFLLWILFNHCLSIKVPYVNLPYRHVLLLKLCESLIQFFSVEIAFFERCPSLTIVAVVVGSDQRGVPSHIHNWRRLTWRERWKDLWGQRIVIVISSLNVLSSLDLG